MWLFGVLSLTRLHTGASARSDARRHADAGNFVSCSCRMLACYMHHRCCTSTRQLMSLSPAFTLHAPLITVSLISSNTTIASTLGHRAYWSFSLLPFLPPSILLNLDQHCYTD